MGMTLGDLIVRIRGEQGGLDGDLKQAEGKVNASAGRMGGFFTGALQHAVGGAILGGVRTVMQAAGNVLSEAFDATAGYESMSAALNTLLTKEIQDQSVQTKRIAIGMQTIQVTEGGREANLKKGESEAELAQKIASTTAQLALQRENLAKATSGGQESSAEIEVRRQRMAEMEQQIATTNAKLADQRAKLDSATAGGKESATELEVRRQKVAELEQKIETLNAKLVVQRENLEKGTSSGKESSAELEVRRQKVAELEQKLVELNERTGEAGTVTEKQVAVYKEEKTAAMDIITARKLASQRTEELLKWSQKLAIQSPYGQDDVISALKMAMALGYNSDQAQRLTQANINFASATGASGEVMSRVSLALGQMYTKGRLMGGEMLQLTEAGVPMKQMLVESGKVAGLTAENFEDLQRDGLIPAKLAYEAYVEYIEKNFNTAAKDQANTLKGLQNSWEDLKKVVLRVGLGPIFKAMQPAIQKVVDLLQTPKFIQGVERIGQGIGDFFGNGIGAVMRFFEILDLNTKDGVKPVIALRYALASIVPPEFMPIVNDVTRMLDRFNTAFTATGNLGYGVREALKSAFGKDFDQTFGATVQTIIGLPEKIGEAIGKIKEGKLGEALDGLWGDLGLGTIDLGLAISKLLEKLGVTANSEQTIKAAGDAFFGWGAAALKWMDEKLTSKAFEEKVTGPNGIAARLGFAAGNTAAAIAGALGAWVAELAGFPKHVTPEQMQPPIVQFVENWAKSISTNKKLTSDIGKAFWKGLLEGIGVEAPTAQELAKLLDNPTSYAVNNVGAPIGRSINNAITGKNKPNRFMTLTKEDLVDPANLATVTQQVGADMAGGVQVGFRQSIEANLKNPQNDYERSVAKTIRSIMDALGIHSPSTVTAEQIGVPMAQGIGAGFASGTGAITAAMMQTGAILQQVAAPWPAAFTSIGARLMDGMIAGIRNKAGEVKAALLGILPPALQSILRQMGIASPSRVTMRIGNQIMDGFVLPFQQRAGEIADALTSVIAPMTQAPALAQFAGAGVRASGGAGAQITINMNGVSMASDMDAYTTAYRIAKRVRDGV